MPGEICLRYSDRCRVSWSKTCYFSHRTKLPTVQGEGSSTLTSQLLQLSYGSTYLSYYHLSRLVLFYASLILMYLSTDTSSLGCSASCSLIYQGYFWARALASCIFRLVTPSFLWLWLSQLPHYLMLTNGFFVSLGHSPITWKSKKQNTISCSSGEVEYLSMAITCCELKWLRYLLKDIRVPQTALHLCSAIIRLHYISLPILCFVNALSTSR